MALIRWLDSFDIGIPEIDFEHRELVGLINACHEHVLDPHDGSDVSDFLGLIYARISSHFTHEELEMMRLEYVEYWAHKADHERLLDELRQTIVSWEQSHTIDDEALSAWLERWFLIHFRTFDARLHRYVDEKRLGQ